MSLFFSDFDDNLSSQALKPATQPLERTLIGNDEEEEDEIVINRLVLDDDVEGEDISFTGEFANAIDSTPLATCNRNIMLQFEEKRPDTGMFFFLPCLYMYNVQLHFGETPGPGCLK